VRAAIGLGSNLGDRRAHLRRGVAGLAEAGLEVGARSSVWESEPVDSSSGLWFLNMVVLVRTAHSPRELLGLLQALEQRAGRVRGAPNAPRTLDLDLLDLAGIRLAQPDLELPHPRMWRRRFVLAPLVEIAPELVNPRTGRTAAEHLAALDDAAIVVRLGPLDGPRPRESRPRPLL
jgi:2-amino-4-hydroxy-6-hydroxymethyldihydropteridine diphosphokinase